MTTTSLGPPSGNLINHFPTALLQVDSTPMIAIFDRFRREGVTDIAGYLQDNSELAIHARSVVRVTDANRDAADLFAAKSVDQLIGSVDYLFAASPATTKRIIAAHFEGRRSFTEIIKLRTFNGGLRDVELTLTFPRPPDRLDITFISLGDITERLNAESRRCRLQRELVRMDRMALLNEIARWTGHKVNQPLAAIVTNAETTLRWLARDEPDLAKIEQLAGRIAQSAYDASGIVENLRLAKAEDTIEATRLDVNEVIAESLMVVSSIAESYSIAFDADFAPDLPAMTGNRLQLLQAIANIVDNAVEAIVRSSKAGGRIELRTARLGDEAVSITIRDNGPGFVDAYIEQIFEAFFAKRNGTVGAGLSICRSIIAAHGGTITASNHRQGGAQFEICIPAVAPKV